MPSDEEKEFLHTENELVEVTLTPKVQPTRIPWRKLLPIFFIQTSEAFTATSIFAYIGYMVYDFKITDRKEELGYYAGLIASSFFFAQLISSFFWGKLSDRWGRRPVLLLGSAGAFIASMGLGFSLTLPMAIVFRSLSGLLNGNTGVVKTYLGELTDSTNQAKTFGYMGFTWGLGSIVGSSVGGLLARPAVKYPNIFPPESIFGRFPYLLVNMVCSLLLLISLFLAYFFITENPRKDRHKLFELELKTSNDFYNFDNKNVDNSESNSLLLEEEEPHEKTFKVFQKNMTSIIGPYTEPLNIVVSSTNPALIIQEKSIFKDKWVIITCVLYAFTGFAYTVCDEVYPLWAMQEVSVGGLGFTTVEIGIVNAIAGSVTVMIQLFIYHRIANRIGIIWCFRAGCLLAVPVFVFYPFTNFLFVHVYSESMAVLWVHFCVFALARQLASQLMFSAVMNLVSNSVESKNMGAVNGLGQSLVAGTRGVGPVVGATLLSWSLGNGLSFPLNFYFVFVCLSFVALMMFFMSLRMNTSLNKPKQDYAEDDPTELPTELS